MTREHQQENITQEILARPQFVRFAEVFETYQQMLDDYKDDTSKLVAIKNRMRTVFDEKEPLDESDAAKQRATEFNRVKNELLSLCESGEWTKEKAAQSIASSSVAGDLLESWRPMKPGQQENGNVAVNEVLEYGIESNGEELFINLIPPAVQGKEFLRKAVDGLRVIAKALQVDSSPAGRLGKVRTVMAASWLFDHLENATKRLFGDDITLEEVPNDSEYARSVQFLALSHNKRVMATYLKAGEFPSVRKLTMTREAFIERFAS